MTYLLTNAEDIATITVAIYHRTGRDLFIDSNRLFNAEYFDFTQYKFELAYAYERADEDRPVEDILEAIYGGNNTVSGSEVNVKLNKRSLSVGDVVVLGGLVNFRGEGIFEVQSFGFQEVSKMSPQAKRQILYRLFQARSAAGELTKVDARYIASGSAAGSYELTEVI